MIAIDSLVPDFPKALDKLPGRSQAWQTLSESLDASRGKRASPWAWLL